MSMVNTFRSIPLKVCNLNFFFYLHAHSFAYNYSGYCIFLINSWEVPIYLDIIFLVVRLARVKMFHPIIHQLFYFCPYLSYILMVTLFVNFFILYSAFLKKKCLHNHKLLGCFPIFSCTNL